MAILSCAGRIVHLGVILGSYPIDAVIVPARLLPVFRAPMHAIPEACYLLWLSKTLSLPKTQNQTGI